MRHGMSRKVTPALKYGYITITMQTGRIEKMLKNNHLSRRMSINKSQVDLIINETPARLQDAIDNSEKNYTQQDNGNPDWFATEQFLLGKRLWAL